MIRCHALPDLRHAKQVITVSTRRVGPARRDMKDLQPLLSSAEVGRAVVRTRRPQLHRLVHCAAGLALLFIGTVLSSSTCLCTVPDVLSSVLSSGAPDAPLSRLPSNQTCFSRAAAEGEKWQPLARSFRYKGEVRQSPLPRRTRYRQQPKAADWPASDVPRERALWYIRGEAYDLREFVSLHPGGRRYLQNTVGSDVTELFEARLNRHPEPEPEPEPESLTAHHIGYTALNTLPRYRVAAGAAAPPRRPHGGHSSGRFKALKAQLAARFDLNHLKEPHPEYTALLWATLTSHVALFAGCVLAPSAGHAWARHSALGLTTAWLGAFAHNGLHMWSRRRAEALAMYLTFSNNPFRWMYKHVVSHHVHTNTCFDGDKKVVPDFQQWWRTKPLLNVFGLTLGTFIIGVKSSCCQAPESLSMTTWEQKLPLLILGASLLLGLRVQGRWWLPRFVWTMAIASTYTFVLFQVSHYQAETLDGDAIHANSDDWADFQLRTTWGWRQTSRPLVGLPWLFLNLQPAHHIFPAVHHSRLREITPTIREHYPGLMEDHAIFPMVRSMLRILWGRECVQCVDEESCRKM